MVVLLHLTHMLAALISVIVVIYNHYKQRYTIGNTVGIEIAATFWHFVDVLWIYLFLFFFIWCPASTAKTIVTEERINIKVIKAT